MPSTSKSSVAADSRVASELRRAYDLMRARFGHQGWWPADSPFEVCVGAILTQNTNWKNVERAIANLKRAGALNPFAMNDLPLQRLAVLIRPAGYYNIKACRLKAFIRVLVEEFGGELTRLFSKPLGKVRARLLQIHGVGPETADSMLLYAGGHPSFVIDAYTKRIFHRHGWCGPCGAGPDRPCNASYEELKVICERALNQFQGVELLDYWQDYHAQLVAVGKQFCLKRQPVCAGCPLEAFPRQIP